MNRIPRSIFTACVFALNSFVSHAETGMALVVSNNTSLYDPGNILRIDVEGSSVSSISNSLGWGNYPRFSPDGNVVVVTSFLGHVRSFP